MAQVFISYNKRDRALAEMVAGALRRGGLTVWWDDEVTPREQWDRILEREIALADKVLVLWTRNSVESDWVRIEANFARNCRPSKLVQARFDHSTIPIAFSLIQYVDLDWHSFEDGRGWRKLLSFLDSSLEAATPSQITPHASPTLPRKEPAHSPSTAKSARQPLRWRWWHVLLMIVAAAGSLFSLTVLLYEWYAKSRAPYETITAAGELSGSGSTASWYPEHNRYVSHIYFEEADVLDNGCATGRVNWKPVSGSYPPIMEIDLCFSPDRLAAARAAQRQALPGKGAASDIRLWRTTFQAEGSR